MHFIEPFLKDIKVKDLEMENFAGTDIIPIVTKFMKQSAKKSSDKDMLTFATALENSFDICDEAYKIRSDINVNFALSNRIFPKNIGEYTAIPAGWSGPKGHAILLIIEKHPSSTISNEFLNLIVINTGLGIKYHDSVSDFKSNISPLKFRVWKKFDKIPKFVFNEDNNWFIQSLGLLYDNNEMYRALNDDYEPEKHFYETIMGNFKSYEVKDETKDDRFLIGQLSGSCAYSSLTAGLLYISKDQKQFLSRKFMYGLILLEDFLSKCDSLDTFKKILSDAYEPMARYLMKHLASGVAFQALEYLESNDIELGYADLLSSKKGSSAPALDDLKKFTGLEHIKTAVACAIKIHKLLSDTKIDKTSALIVHEDISSCSPETIPTTRFNRATFSLSNDDIEKLKIDENNWLGTKHPYISSESDYTNFFPISFSSASQLALKLEEIAQKSTKIIHVDTIMNTYVYDFFKIAQPNIDSLIKMAALESCLSIMKSAKKIMKQFMEQSILPMAAEDLAAATQLLLLTWKAALQYDSQPRFLYKSLGLKNYCAPAALIAPMSTTFDPLDPISKIRFGNFRIDTCAAAPAWLTTEDEYEAWIMFQQASSELDSCKSKPSIYDPTEIFPTVDQPSASATALRNYKAINVLKEIAKQFSIEIRANSHLFKHKDLIGPYLVLRGIFDTTIYPQFHYLIEVATYLYFGPWYRPYGLSDDNSETFAQFDVCEMIFGPYIFISKPKRAETKYPPFLRQVAVRELLKYRQLACKTGTNPDFALNEFADVRAAAAMQYSGTEIRFYAFFSLIEGSKSCVFFEHSPLVLIADRLLGVFSYFYQDPNLIKRTHETLKLMIASDLVHFKSKHELMESTKKEKYLDRLMNASLIHVRFLIRLESWKISKEFLQSKELIETIAKIYNDWAPIGHLKSSYELSEDMIGKINLFLWDCVNSGKNFEDFSLFSKIFVSNLSEYKTDVDAENIVRAHVSYRYFLASAFSKKMVTSKNFDIMTKIYVKLRNPSKLTTKNSAEKALKLIVKEMVTYYEPAGTDLDNDWNYAIDDKFEFIEIRKKDSASKIPFIILRISTGRIIFNGVSVIHKSKIYNHPVFRQFFKKEELVHARNGSIKPIGDKIGYSLSGFRGTGQNFLFITSGEDTVMDIFYHHDKDRWLWSNPDKKSTKAFLAPLRLMNINGIRIYQKVHIETNILEAIFMKGAETVPLYRLTIENIDKPDKSQIKMKLPFIEKPVLLLKPDEAEKKLAKAFKSFSDPQFVSVYRTEDNRAVIMYGHYRFAKEDVPLIFEERIDESDPNNEKKIFVLLNHDNWCIDEDQAIDKEKILLGIIKIRSISDPKSKALLIPNFRLIGLDELFEEKKKRNKANKKNKMDMDDNEDEYLELNLDLIPVELIKTSGGDLMPKDRYERLVLAYKFMIILEIDMARKLLHPIQSIDQNSPFNDEELKILEWILKLHIVNPEINALKMMTAAHYYINSFNYISSKKKYSPDNIGSIAIYYLLSLRQLSNKFYLHRIFPEVIENDDLFHRLFHFENMSINGLTLVESNPETENFCIHKAEVILSSASKAKNIESPQTFNLQTFNWRKINFIVKLDENNIWDLFELIRNNNIDIKNYYRIHYRRNEVPTVLKSTLDSFDFELLLYCAQDDSSIRNYLYLLARDRKLTLNNHNLREDIKSSIIKCISKRRNEMIKTIVQPNDHSKSVTDIELTKIIFKNDLKSKKISNNFATKTQFIDINVSKLVENLIQLITNFSISKTKSLHIGASKKWHFEEESKRVSIVLTKLCASIEKFNSNRAIDGSIEIDLKSDESDEKIIIEHLGTLQNYLTTLIKKSEEELRVLAAELVTETSTENVADGTNLISELSFSNHFKKPKTFASLYGCYYSQTLECFIKKFPHISEDKAMELRGKTHIFYSKNVLQDYYNFMNEKTKNLIDSKTKVSLDDLTAFVVEAKKLETFDTRIENPGILNFEFRSKKFRLREEQTKDLDILRGKDGNNNEMFKSIVIQRMMAAGKTLVLGTLATVLKAREPDILSILVPPSSLFQSNSASMQSRTYDYFKSRGTVLNFERIPIPTNERSVNSVILFLKWFRDNLNITFKTGNYLIMSPDSLQSFLNSYIEFLNHYTSSGNFSTIESILKIYAEIYEIFVNKSSIILDEIDMTMNPKKELNFPTMHRENYNLIAVALTTDLIEFSIFSKNVMKQNLNILRNNQAGLTPLAYENIRQAWFEYIEISLDDEKSLWNQKLLYPKHNELTKENILKFLKCTDVSKYSTWVDEIKTTSENLLQLKAIIIMKRQMDEFLMDAFKSTVKEHFGPAGPSRPNIKYAVPYVAANTPSESSLFADRWETLNKSLLMTAVVGLSESDYVDFIFWLKEQINIESISTGSVINTATYENFYSLIDDLNPLSINLEDPVKMKLILSELDKKNRAGIRLLFSFYLDMVISKIEFPTEQITSNALHMASMVASVQGYSGTIDNINILPSEVVQEAYIDHISNEQNNGGIVQKLIFDSNDKNIAIVNGMDSIKNARNNIRNLLKAIPEADQVNFSALIDVGAFFKNFRNAKVAEALLRINSPRIKCVLYYDENSNMLQYVVENIQIKDDSSSMALSESGGEKSKLSSEKKWMFNHGKLSSTYPDSITDATGYGLSERFTFYDQRHITGSDILQPPNAIALLTFGSRNLLRDILQGTLRMRQFMTSQRVVFVITPDVISYYNSLLSTSYKTLTISNVIALSAFNEDEKQGRENGALSFVKIDVRIRSGILKDITDKINSNSFNDIIAPFKKARGLFIRNFSEDPLSWIKERKLNPAKVSLLNFIESRKSFADQKHIDSLDPLIQDCARETLITDSLFCFTPEYLPEFKNDMMMNSEIQLELNSLQLNEFELESVNEDSKFKDSAISYNRFRLHQCCVISTMHNIVSYNSMIDPAKNMNQKAKDRLAASLINKNLNSISFSRDLVNIVESSGNVCPYDLLGSFNLEGTHIFIVAKSIRHFAPYEVLLVSNDVADQILIDYEENLQCNLNWYLTDLMGNILLSNAGGDLRNKNILDHIVNIREQFFNLLIINGSLLQLSSQPILKEIFFKSWVKKQGLNGGLAFLISRMRVLQNKLRFLFDSEDPLISTISKVINGDDVAANDLANETYDSNSEDMKKLEMAKSAEALKSAALHRAQGIYDKVSIKMETENPKLTYVFGENFDEISDGESESDDESNYGLNGENNIDMLDSSELIRIINDKSIHANILKSSENDPNHKYLTEKSSSSTIIYGIFISIGALFIAFGIGTGVYYYFLASEAENKVEDKLSDKKNENDVDNEDNNGDEDGYSMKPTYNSADLGPVSVSTSYTAASNYYSNDANNSASYTAFNNANYYTANNNYYNNSNNYGYNNADYNNSDYNNSYNAGYNNPYNTGHANYFDARYNTNYCTESSTPVYSECNQSFPSSPTEYETNDECKADNCELSMSKMLEKNDSQSDQEN